MAALRLDLADDLRARAEARAAESGHATLQSYIESLVRADTADNALPDHIDRLLTERASDQRPSVEFTAQLRAEFMEQVRQRREANKTSQS